MNFSWKIIFLLKASYTKQLAQKPLSKPTLLKENIIIYFFFLFSQRHHLLNVTCSLLFQSHLPMNFWCYAIFHVVLLINYIPTPQLNNIFPYEKLHKKRYNVSTLRLFGYLCYVNNITIARKKLDSIIDLGIFLGFKPNTTCYMLLNLKNSQNRYF